MTELQIGFLFNAASHLSKSTSNKTQMILKSYYLMRCKEITNRLPEKQFSKSSRCPHCYVEWNANTETKVKSLRLTKKQRRRIRLSKKNSSGIRKEEKLLKGKILEKTCSFCNHKTTCVLETHKSDVPDSIEVKKPEVRKEENKKVLVPTHKTGVCVYSNSRQVFSLTNQNNTLTNIVRNSKKDIKNSKKKKDKFAGLCQKAVLSANNMKQNKEKQNKINLFLKPSA